jgi:hypothetical protein
LRRPPPTQKGMLIELKKANELAGKKKPEPGYAT